MNTENYAKENATAEVVANTIFWIHRRKLLLFVLLIQMSGCVSEKVASFKSR